MSPPNLYLPLIDLSSTDRASTAKSIRQACMDHGFFYVINHGIDDFVVNSLFRESKNFFDLPLSEKMKLEIKTDYRGYSPPYAETLNPSSKLKGDLKETFDIGPINDSLNQWPSKERMPAWRVTMESYDEKIMNVAVRLISLIALALNLDENFFTKIGALDSPMGFLRLLHYPGEIPESEKGKYGASAHSDYGMITLLVTDGVPGLQICREKDRSPQLWEDVHHVEGALIVNIGDMMERWTNCIFRSTVHRVVAVGQERYSVAFFLDPNNECVVECLENCCSETSPPRNVGFRLISLISLALNLDENFFTKIGALDSPVGFLRLLHYPGEIPESKKGSYGASAHSDYVMITLLVTDGVPGLQICREKDRSPQLWEDVHHVEGALIINIGDMMERWTNCTFRSIVHRVVAVGQERYSAAFFLNPNYDCVVECLESCCSETSPPRFPPIKSGDYLEERLRVAYSR